MSQWEESATIHRRPLHALIDGPPTTPADGLHRSLLPTPSRPHLCPPQRAMPSSLSRAEHRTVVRSKGHMLELRYRRVLHIKSAIIPSGVRIAVADSGAGIDRESIDRIFDMFFTTKSHGMGMGLSICRSIIEAHGGKLSASPSRPYGSIFEVDLPAAKMNDQ